MNINRSAQSADLTWKERIEMAKEVLYRHEEFIVKWFSDGMWFNYTNYLSSYSLAVEHEKRHNEMWPNLKTRIVRKIILEEVM
jgi:hypothetical protein